MSTDPIDRLPSAVGSVLERFRRERNWDAATLANASDVSPLEILGVEAGTHIPTLLGFFRLATALGESPVILLTEVIAKWRADSADHGLYRSRPSDLARLYRLGYFHDPGDFRELPGTYTAIDHATTDARKISAARIGKDKPPIDTLTIYVRVGYLQIDTVSS